MFADAITKLLLHTDVGFGEAFVDGDITTSDIRAVLKVLLDNRDYASNYESWTGSVLKTLDHLW